MEYFTGKVSNIARKVVRVETQPYEEALQVHLDKMTEIEAEQTNIHNQIRTGTITTDLLRQLGEVYDRATEERVYGLARERTLVIFGKKQIPLSPKRS